MSTAVTVENNTESRSYDALIGTRVVASIIYELAGTRIVFSHTIVEPEFRGQGVASTLIREALADVRAKGMTLTNHCPFVAGFIDEPSRVRRPDRRRTSGASAPSLTRTCGNGRADPVLRGSPR